MHSSRVGQVVVAMLAVLVFGAVAAAAAQAEEAPFWSIEGTRLRAGETHYITGTRFISEKEKNNFELSIDFGTFNVIITCEAVRLNEGVILGSSAGEPGTNGEYIYFEKCSQKGNGESCTVQPVITKRVRSELVEDVHRERLDMEFSPASGVILMTVGFFGTCKVERWNLAGELAGEVLTDPGEEPVSATKSTKQSNSWLIRFPATPIKEVWLEKVRWETPLKSAWKKA